MSVIQIELRKVPEESHFLTCDRVNLFHNIKAMMERESAYVCNEHTLNEKGFKENLDDFSQPTKKKKRKLNEIEVFIVTDKHRQEMCEWSCRIVDYFNGDRELVAIAQNYLDRFLDAHHCDCTGFKLAAITCLCLAIKVHNQKPISMKSLSSLSNGEITVQDISDMESMILKNLDWKLCPPIASNFCKYLIMLLPTKIKTSVRKSILEWSCFFTELSLFECSFLLLRQSEIAFAAILNAVEKLNSSNFPSEDRNSFIENLEYYSGIDKTSDQVNIARDRMWDLYDRSKQSIELSKKKR